MIPVILITGSSKLEIKGIKMIKLEKMIKKLELILAGVMLPTMIIFVILELNRLMTGTETDYGYLAITMIMTLLLGTLEVQFSMKEEIKELKMELKNINKKIPKFANLDIGEIRKLVLCLEWKTGEKGEKRR